jgi:hypothetical protein
MQTHQPPTFLPWSPMSLTFHRGSASSNFAIVCARAKCAVMLGQPTGHARPKHEPYINLNPKTSTPGTFTPPAPWAAGMSPACYPRISASPCTLPCAPTPQSVQNAMECTPRKERRPRALQLRASPRTGPVCRDARSSPPASTTPHSPAPYAGFGARGQASTRHF